MIPDGIHAPEQVVHAESHPGQGNVVGHMKRGPHPSELAPAEPSIVGVVQKIHVIVPVYELVVQRWQEGREGDEGHQRRREPADPASGLLGAYVSEQFPVLGLDGCF